MEMIFTLIPVLILVVIFATIGNEGLWSNAIALFNVVTAGLLAVNFWEPATAMIRGSLPGGVHVWDFLALWGLFVLFYSVMRGVSDLVSRTKVRFPKHLDTAGGYVMAAWVGWVMVCFTMMTLHTAPLGREFLFGGFKAEKEMFFGLAPDRQWLGFVQKSSRGSLSRGASKDNPDLHAFDPKGEFMVKYAARRKIMESGKSVRVKTSK